MHRMEFEQQAMFGGGRRYSEFSEYFKCYSITSMTSPERHNLNYAGKIILPQSALAKLSALHIEYPMLFELHNEQSDTVVHAGVLEFTAQEGKVYMPQWMMRQLEAHEGEILKIKSTTLPLGTFLKIQPQSVDFLDITDPKAVLENALRQYSALTQGDIIAIRYNNKVYELLCMEIKPDTSKYKGITIIETDLSVDFAPPVGYVDPAIAARSRHDSTRSAASAGSELSVDEHKISENKWQVFSGGGQRLSGKPLTAKTLLKSEFKQEKQENLPPDALRIPNNKLWFGYPIVPYKSEDEKKKEKDIPFQGSGQSLRK